MEVVSVPVQKNSFGKTNTSAADRACLEAMGVALEQMAKPVCPVLTGNLRRSHSHRVSGDHVDIGVTADYGSAVHNGTSRQRAQPWLRNAAQRNANFISKAGEAAWKRFME